MDKQEHQETIAVRNGEDFDREALKQYLIQHVEGLPEKPLDVTQFPTGVSNLTYLLQCGQWEAVMRRPPNGPLPPKAHDMKRESELLKRLHPVFPLVPKPYVYCEDPTVLGVPFYVMERKQGIVLNDDYLTGDLLSVEDCRRISYAMVDTLAELHQVDYRKAGLSDFGHPVGFLERQVQSWIKRYERFKTDDIGIFDKLSVRLSQSIPVSQEATIIHNDYKVNNMLFSDDSFRIEAILDWEMATVADPLFDLAGALGYWIQPDDPDPVKESLPAITAATPGFLSRREFIERYSLKTGRDIPPFDFYMAFTYFKLAVVYQQIYYRWKTGQTQDKRFSFFINNVKHLMNYAYEVSINKNYLY
jgi:aminoglycoside phosphotransferase (APT) family kinase protein